MVKVLSPLPDVRDDDGLAVQQVLEPSGNLIQHTVPKACRDGRTRCMNRLLFLQRRHTSNTRLEWEVDVTTNPPGIYICSDLTKAPQDSGCCSLFQMYQTGMRVERSGVHQSISLTSAQDLFAVLANSSFR